MPALPTVPKGLRVAWQQDLAGRLIENILHYTYSGSPSTQADLNASADDLAGFLKTLFNAGQSVDLLNNAITVTDISSVTGLVAQRPVTGAGTDASGLVPAQVAAVISWKVVRRYRGGHPRTYVGGLPEDAFLDEKTFKPAYTAAWNARALAYQSSMAGHTFPYGGTWTPVNVSYFQGFHNVTLPSGRVRSEPTLRITPLVDVLTVGLVNARPDTQRRRLGK